MLDEKRLINSEWVKRKIYPKCPIQGRASRKDAESMAEGFNQMQIDSALVSSTEYQLLAINSNPEAKTGS